MARATAVKSVPMETLPIRVPATMKRRLQTVAPDAVPEFVRQAIAEKLTHEAGKTPASEKPAVDLKALVAEFRAVLDERLKVQLGATMPSAARLDRLDRRLDSLENQVHLAVSILALVAGELGIDLGAHDHRPANDLRAKRLGDGRVG